MEFRTSIEPYRSSFSIHHQHKLMTLGSCFSQHIGERLQSHKFDVQLNPFCTLFNPISLLQLLRWKKEGVGLPPSHYLDFSGHHLDLHSSFHGDTYPALQQQWEDLQVDFSELDVCFVTLGTAWVYVWQVDGQIIANCHKQPSAMFERRLLRLEEITMALEEIVALLPEKCQAVLTVSPVRHTKDTLPLNSVSKSLLRVACHQVSEAHTQVSYFPAYEIVMDDLRDYRFFEADMIHPNATAVQYIWEYFSNAFLKPETQQLNTSISKVMRGMQHRAFQPESEVHQKFLRSLLKSASQLAAQGVSMGTEIKIIEGQLVKR